MLKKYSITALFSLLMIFTALTGAGFAETTESEMSQETAAALAQVYVANDEIYTEIARVQALTEVMYEDYLTTASEAIDEQQKTEAWNSYDSEVEAAIAELNLTTQAMTLQGMSEASAAGLTVEMEWVPVQFADRLRMIDPIKVIDW